jgi:hypothetical protein
MAIKIISKLKFAAEDEENVKNEVDLMHRVRGHSNVVSIAVHHHRVAATSSKRRYNSCPLGGILTPGPRLHIVILLSTFGPRFRCSLRQQHHAILHLLPDQNRTTTFLFTSFLCLFTGGIGGNFRRPQKLLHCHGAVHWW